MNNKLAYSTLLILIIISSVVYSQEEVNPKIEPKCIASTSNADFENKFLEKYNADPKGICNTDLAKAEKLGLLKGKDLGTFNPQEIQELGKKLGQDWSDIASFNGATLNEDGTLSRGTLTTKEGNTISNPENYKKENNNIIADSLEFLAKEPSTFSTINPIDSTKINFNIPKGGSVKLTNKEGIFETITSEGVEEEIISRCIGPIIYTSEEKQSTLIIQRSLDSFNTLYTISNAAIQHDADGKKQLVRSKTLPAEVEIDSECSGIVCADLGIASSLDYEDSMFNSFYLEFPEVGQIEQNYKFCFDKSEGDGYKIKDSFVLDKAVKLFNYKKDLVYQGFDSNNKALFRTEAGIAKGFKIKNLAPEKQLIAKLYPSKSFIIIEEKEHSYLTLLDQLPDYTAIESYEPELISSSPDFWIASDILYQEGEKGNLGAAYPPENKELERLLNKGSTMLDEVKEALKRWNNKELLEQL